MLSVPVGDAVPPRSAEPLTVAVTEIVADALGVPPPGLREGDADAVRVTVAVLLLHEQPEAEGEPVEEKVAEFVTVCVPPEAEGGSEKLPVTDAEREADTHAVGDTVAEGHCVTLGVTEPDAEREGEPVLEREAEAEAESVLDAEALMHAVLKALPVPSRGVDEVEGSSLGVLVEAELTEGLAVPVCVTDAEAEALPLPEELGALVPVRGADRDASTDPVTRDDSEEVTVAEKVPHREALTLGEGDGEGEALSRAVAVELPVPLASRDGAAADDAEAAALGEPLAPREGEVKGDAESTAGLGEGLRESTGEPVPRP